MPGPEFLYANSSSGLILAFPVDRNSGALGAPVSTPGPAMSFGIVSAQNQFLYVSDSQTAAVDAFSINQTTGALTAVPGSPFSFGSGINILLPQWLVAGSDLYMTGFLGLAGGSIGPDGALTPVPGSPFQLNALPAQAALGPSNANPSTLHLYVTDFADPNGAITAFTVDPSSGTLSPLPGTVATFANSAPDGIVFEAGPNAFVFVTLPATNQIAAFTVDQTSGALTPVPNSPFGTGNHPTYLVLNSFQNALYSVNSLDGTVSAFSIASNGGLTPVGSPYPVGADPQGIVLSSDSRFLYVANPTSNTILGFSIGSMGALSPLPGSPFPANGATLLTLVQIPPP
jgi:6-phosphogluconolactonase